MRDGGRGWPLFAQYGGAADRLAAAAAQTGSLPPPAEISNVPTKMMKDRGYGANYAYEHDEPNGFLGQNCSPDDMPRSRYYHPVERGHEREIAKHLAYRDWLRAAKQGSDPSR